MADGARLLREFIKNEGKSLRGAAKEIGISHPTLFSWCRGRTVPLSVFREKLERWSDGRVLASAWQSTREKDAMRAVAKAEREIAKAG